MKKENIILVLVIVLCLSMAYNLFLDGNPTNKERALYDQLNASQEDLIKKQKQEINNSLNKINNLELQLKNNEEQYKQTLDSISNMSSSELHDFISEFIN